MQQYLKVLKHSSSVNWNKRQKLNLPGAGAWGNIISYNNHTHKIRITLQALCALM